MGVISSCALPRNRLTTRWLRDNTGEVDSSLDVDICNKHRGNGQKHLQVWRPVNSNPCFGWLRDNPAHDHGNRQLLLEAIVLESNSARVMSTLKRFHTTPAK